jgi:carbohydrate diacid regulator
MLNKLFQGIINQTMNSIGRSIGVIDETSVIVACSELNRIGELTQAINPQTSVNIGTFIVGNATYKLFGNTSVPEFAVFVAGTDEMAKNYVNILTVTLYNTLQYHNEKFDKASFIKNILFDNVLPGDIYLKTKKLKFNADVNRVCVLIKTVAKNDVSVLEIIKKFFPDKNKDFVIYINELDVALVKEVSVETDEKALEKLSESIVDTLDNEYHIKCVVGIGTIVPSIRALARSFKEAQIAIEVGKVFDAEKTIIAYGQLGISRLVYQLPTRLCEMFLKEVFKKGSVEAMDQEILFTIQKFFENSLNVSETSRKLFVHRNTLVYRLEKIKKITGLDLREFEDAIVFKVALMVKKYLIANPIKF